MPVRRFMDAFASRVVLALMLVVAIVKSSETQAAAAQDWSPFVLVFGLLLVGMVAEGDGLFAAAGGQLARAAGTNSAISSAMIVRAPA